jgi:hypothetical protein
VRTTLVVATLMVSGIVAHGEAQTPQPRPQARPSRPFVERGFVTIGAGMQAAAERLSEHAQFQINAETGTLDATYPGNSGVLFDAGAGFRIHKAFGIAVAVSRASSAVDADVSAAIPHPFFDNRDRTVTGRERDLTRTETAVHAQLYYDLTPRGRWRAKLFAGPSYFNVEQELVTEVQAIETFPFDTAEFGSATTQRAKGRGLGFHAGVDAARMLTRRLGLGALIRYARASVDLDGPDASGVSTTGGGFQAGASVRMLW